MNKYKMKIKKLIKILKIKIFIFIILGLCLLGCFW